MGLLVTAGATLQCSFGATPCPLVVLPLNRVLGMLPAATIMDNKPIVNILSFGMCSSPANPIVVAATAAKLGVFTPMPCIPATVAPWIIGKPTVLIGGLPALTNDSKLICSWGGVIQVCTPGQFKVQL